VACSPDGAKRNPGQLSGGPKAPHCASLHAGYEGIAREKMTPKLNEFQLTSRESLRQIFDGAGVVASFEIGGGPAEFAAKISFGQFETWIYPDGADVSGPGVDKRYEIYDFDSLDELQRKYVSYIQELVRAHA
jgi:hypothetical protein